MTCRLVSPEMSTVGMVIERKVPGVGPEKVGIPHGLPSDSCAESGAGGASSRAVRSVRVGFMAFILLFLLLLFATNVFSRAAW